MYVNFYKSLDRQVDIFGIKGKWVVILIVLLVCSLVIGLVLGFSIRAGIGIVAFFLCGVASFLFCLLIQEKVSSRQVAKVTASNSIYHYVTRYETLSRILLPDPHVASWFYEDHKDDIVDPVEAKDVIDDTDAVYMSKNIDTDEEIDDSE
jgi:hypothetical protein